MCKCQRSTNQQSNKPFTTSLEATPKISTKDHGQTLAQLTSFSEHLVDFSTRCGFVYPRVGFVKNPSGCSGFNSILMVSNYNSSCIVFLTSDPPYVWKVFLTPGNHTDVIRTEVGVDMLMVEAATPFKKRVRWVILYILIMEVKIKI